MANPRVDPLNLLSIIRQRGINEDVYTANRAAAARIKREQAAAQAQKDQVNSYLSGLSGSGINAPQTPTFGPGSWVGKAAPAGKHTTNPALLHSPGKNLITINTKAGKVTVNKTAAAAFTGFLNELTGQGYKVNSLGGYANRQNVNNPAKKSHHAYGYAIDINPAQNPNLRGRLVTNLPSNISALAAKYGLGWGGNWKSVKDSMHFEYLGY